MSFLASFFPAFALFSALFPAFLAVAPEAPKALEQPPPILYTDPDFGFSFSYPSDFTVGSLEDPETYFVLVQDPDTHAGVQIAVSPYDDPFYYPPPEQLEAWLGDTLLSPITFAIVGPGIRIPAFTFLAKDDGLGQTREVWFIYMGFLHQLSGYPTKGELLDSILATWSFNYP